MDFANRNTYYWQVVLILTTKKIYFMCTLYVGQILDGAINKDGFNINNNNNN